MNKKIVVFLLIIGLAISSIYIPTVEGQADVSNMLMRVGLLFNNNVKSSIHISSQINPFQIGYYDTTTGQFHSAVTIPAGSSYYTIKYNNFSSIELGAFDTIEMAKSHYKKMVDRGYQSYLVIGEDKPRVWITASNDTTYLNGVLNTVKSEYPNARIVTASNKSIVVESQYRVLFETSNTNRNLRLKETIVDNERGPIKIQEKGYYQYIGSLEFVRLSGGIRLVNELLMDEYLYGVVPYEMSNSWPLEALKAQSVAARSYAYKQRNKYSTYGFNVDDTTNCQVFRGYNKGAIQAVNGTKGIVATYNGSVIDAVYSSTAGDYTMGNSQVWGGTQLPYLQSKRNLYDYKSPRYKWTYKSVIYGNDNYGVDGLLDALRRDGIKANNGLYLTDIDKINLEYYYSIEGAPTRVKNAYIYDRRGNVVKLSGSSYYLRFYNKSSSIPEKEKFWSTYFRINNNVNVSIMNGTNTLLQRSIDLSQAKVISGSGTVSNLPGRNQSSYKATYGISSSAQTSIINNEISYDGQGWGHGVGMSQYGAYAMAADLNYTYDKILKYYYTGIQLQQW